jgi:hypothetical protein
MTAGVSYPTTHRDVVPGRGEPGLCPSGPMWHRQRYIPRGLYLILPAISNAIPEARYKRGQNWRHNVSEARPRAGLAVMRGDCHGSEKESNPASPFLVRLFLWLRRSPDASQLRRPVDAQPVRAARSAGGKVTALVPASSGYMSIFTPRLFYRPR